MGEVGHEGHDQLRLDRGQDVGGHHGLEHPGGGHGRDGVHEYILLLALPRQCQREAVDAQLGRGVVHLPEAAEEPGGRGRVDDPAVVLLPHDVPGGPAALVGAVEVHLHDQVPVGVLHLLEGDVAQDARVVQQHVHPAEAVHGRLDDLLAVLHGVVVGHGHAALALDLLNHLVGGVVRLPGP